MRLTEKTLTLAALALAVVTSACSPEAPTTMPSFEKDVAPIFNAHCTRCHTSDNGGPLTNPVKMTKPAACRLNFYEGAPATCAVDGGNLMPACWGAHYCATALGTTMKQYIAGQNDPMPPPPSSLMNDWEREIVTRWIANPIP